MDLHMKTSFQKYLWRCNGQQHILWLNAFDKIKEEWWALLSKVTKKNHSIPNQVSVYKFSSVQFSHSVVSNSLRPHESQHARPPVHHQLPEFTQTHVHRVGDAIQPSHPLSSPSPPAPNPSQHQGLYQWVNCSHEVAKVLEFHLQHHSFQRTPKTDLVWIKC